MTAPQRKFRVSLSEQDSKYLKEIAEQLGINESEVMRKGLQLMALYASTKKEPNEDKSLILKQGEKEQELLVL
jgi:hypothetical protein